MDHFPVPKGPDSFSMVERGFKFAGRVMEARLLFAKEEAYLAAGVQGADLPTEIPKPSPPVLLAPQEQLGVLSWCASLPQGCRQQH